MSIREQRDRLRRRLARPIHYAEVAGHGAYFLVSTFEGMSLYNIICGFLLLLICGRACLGMLNE